MADPAPNNPPPAPAPEPDPEQMPTGEDFLSTFYRPSLVSTETKGDDGFSEAETR